MGYYEDKSRISKSGLDLVNRSPLHYYHAHLRPQPETEDALDEEEKASLLMGRLAHSMFFTPELVNKEFTKAPKVDLRTNIGKDTMAKFTATAGDLTIIRGKMWDEAAILAESLRSNHEVMRYVNQPGPVEHEVYWTHPVTGTACKSKMDKVVTNYARPDGKETGITLILDLKTSKNASRRAFERDVAAYRLHVQAGFYRDAWVAQNPHTDPSTIVFAWIVVEKVAPYAVAIYQCDGADLLRGQAEYMLDLETYDRCVRTNTWPGYSTEAQIISLPAWARK